MSTSLQARIPNSPPWARWRAITLATAFALIVAACQAAPVATPTTAPTGAPTTDAPPTDAPATDAPTAEPTQSGEMTVLTAAWTDFGQMDFSTAGAGGDTEKIMLQIQEPLTTVDPETFEVVGHLAESFELSDDELTWTFRLRPGIPFHDDWGTVTAEDVKYTWEQWMVDESLHGRRDQVRRIVGEDPNNVQVVDELTVTITSPTPQVDLPGFLTPYALGMAIDSKRYHDEMGDEANLHPIGTGPWEFVSAIPDEEVVLDAVQNHWYRTPGFDRLVLKLIDDGAARLLQTQSGDVDITFLDSDLIGEAEAAGLQLIPVAATANTFLVLGGSYFSNPDSLDVDSPWIQADNPEQGLAIRRAMSHAIDRQVILDTILGGYGQLSRGPLIEFPNVPALTDPSWDVPAFDQDLARQLLTEGGYPDGFELEFFQYPDDIDTVSVGEAIAGMWEEVGLTVNRTPGEEDLLEAREDELNTGGTVWVKLAGYNVEPASRLSSYWSGNDVGLPMTHPAIDEAYESMALEADLDARFAIARDLIATLRDEVIGIPLFASDSLFMAGPRVGSYDPMPGIKDMYNLDTIQPAD